MRLVVDRTLYDGGELLSHSPSTAVLTPSSEVRLSPADATALGVADGDRVTLTGRAGSLTAPVRLDAGLGRGTVAMRHGVGPQVPAPLLSVDETVIDVRVEVA
jgi:formate dehydrogenase major subunit